MRQTFTFALAIATLIGFGSERSEAGIISFDGTINSTREISSFATTGADMVGMSVKFVYADGSQNMTNWSRDFFRRPGRGFAYDGNRLLNGSYLTLAGDSFEERWQLTNFTDKTLVKLVLDGGGQANNGKTVFDRSRFDSGDNIGVGTGGSSQGRDFSTSFSGVSVAYSNAVKLDGGTGPVRDLYRTLSIHLGSGLRSRKSLSFRQDTDNASFGLIAVPEPTSMLMFGSVLGLFAVRRRK